jgi:hypothetical protein
MLPARAMRRAQAPSARTVSVPAPAGVNLVDPAGALPAGDALAIVNMLRAEYGLRTASGWREWVTGINSGGEVRSIFPFSGSVAAEDRLFAAAGDGIYDCTGSSAVPTRVYAFPTVEGQSGYGNASGFTTIAGGHYLLVWDELNGYLHYNEAGDTWTLPAQGAGVGEIGGVDPRSLVFGTVHKHRVWAVQRDTGDAWYLATDAITGTATRFPFGPQFRHGGYLVGLWSWTRDGGAGLDDLLVALSSSGDVVIYQGTDPASASTWEIHGVYYIGTIPAGRRMVREVGGELLILSSLGVIPISNLLRGAVLSDLDSYASRKIAPKLGRLLSERTGTGWSMVVHPEDRTLVVLTPEVSGLDREQWAMTLGARGWTQRVGVPMACAESWRGKLYFGTSDGRVCINDGDVDGTTLAGVAGTAIDSWILSAYADLGAASWKTLAMARPHFITDGTAPQWSVYGRTDFDQTEPGSVSYVPQTGTVLIWGSGIWGSSVWGSGSGTAGEWRGISGMGSSVAYALRLNTVARTTLTSVDVMFRPGGAL